MRRGSLTWIGAAQLLLYLLLTRDWVSYYLWGPNRKEDAEEQRKSREKETKKEWLYNFTDVASFQQSIEDRLYSLL